jgi:hypothetical protein
MRKSAVAPSNGIIRHYVYLHHLELMPPLFTYGCGFQNGQLLCAELIHISRLHLHRSLFNLKRGHTHMTCVDQPHGNFNLLGMRPKAPRCFMDNLCPLGTSTISQIDLIRD